MIQDFNSLFEDEFGLYFRIILGHFKLRYKLRYSVVKGNSPRKT